MRAAYCFGLVLAAVSAAVSTGRDGGWIDRDRFPEAYSILTSERVMYPDNITDWPMKIDSGRQLFVDNYVISRMENVVRQYHQPKKYEGNPLMPGMPVAVLYDAKKGKARFRMWYSRSYAESPDGIHWTKPNLGPDGNLVFKDKGEVRGFIYRPDLPERQGRYKVIYEIRSNPDANEPGGFYLYHSRDGIKWWRDPQGPVLQRTFNQMRPTETGLMVPSQPLGFQWQGADHFQACGVGDTSIFQYDPVLGVYTCSAKLDVYMPPAKFTELGIMGDAKLRLRLREWAESDDLIHWSDPRFLMFPDKHDDKDCQIYGHMGFPYESMWIGMVRVHHLLKPGFKQVDLQLCYSRDGRNWLRPDDREPFIGLGDPNGWEADYSGYTKFPPTKVGEQLWFYYYGSRNGIRDNVKPWGPVLIGLAKLRIDGFASLNAADEPGTVITRPMTFRGRKLYVNADVGKAGYVKAAVLTRDMKPVEAFTLDDAAPLTQDKTSARILWKSKKELPGPGDDHLRIKFQFKNAKLYSFWIE